jgi:hypothetical protein
MSGLNLFHGFSQSPPVNREELLDLQYAEKYLKSLESSRMLFYARVERDAFNFNLLPDAIITSPFQNQDRESLPIHEFGESIQLTNPKTTDFEEDRFSSTGKCSIDILLNSTEEGPCDHDREKIPTPNHIAAKIQESDILSFNAWGPDESSSHKLSRGRKRIHETCEPSLPCSHADEQRSFLSEKNFAHLYAPVSEQRIRSQAHPAIVSYANYFPPGPHWAAPPHFQSAGADEPPFFIASGHRNFAIAPPLAGHGMDPRPWLRCTKPPPPPEEEERQARRRVQNREAQRRLRERVRERELQAEDAARAASADKLPLQAAGDAAAA